MNTRWAILMLFALSAGCSTPKLDDRHWAVEIWQPEGRAVVPQEQWTETEKALFLRNNFQKELKELETGTRWLTTTRDWPYSLILWNWDWTNRAVMIRRYEDR